MEDNKPNPPVEEPGIIVFAENLREFIWSIPSAMVIINNVFLGSIICFFIGHKYEYERTSTSEACGMEGGKHWFKCRRCEKTTWDYTK